MNNDILSNSRWLYDVDFQSIKLDEDTFLELGFFEKRSLLNIFMQYTKHVGISMSAFNPDFEKQVKSLTYNRQIEGESVYKIVSPTTLIPDIFVYTLWYQETLYAIPIHTNFESSIPYDVEVKNYINEIDFSYLVSCWYYMRLPVLAYGKKCSLYSNIDGNFKSDILDMFLNIKNIKETGNVDLIVTERYAYDTNYAWLYDIINIDKKENICQ